MNHYPLHLCHKRLFSGGLSLRLSCFQCAIISLAFSTGLMSCSLCFTEMSELLFECYHVPSVLYGVDALYSLQQNQPDAGVCDISVLIYLASKLAMFDDPSNTGFLISRGSHHKLKVCNPHVVSARAPSHAQIDPSSSQCRVCNGTQPRHRSIPHPHNVVSAMAPSPRTHRSLILTMSCLQWHPATAQIDPSSSQCRVCNDTQPPHRSIPHLHNVVSAMAPSPRTHRSLILTMSCLQ